jgi:hypothetical protein
LLAFTCSRLLEQIHKSEKCDIMGKEIMAIKKSCEEAGASNRLE